MKKNQITKRVVLLDAHAILHRAYHALPDFSSSKGEPTGGLYGLATMILKIIEELKPNYVIGCYDLPQATYRHEAYKDYKAGRAKADENLVAQIIRSRDLFTAFSIPIYDKPGFEADDMLGTIAEKLKQQGSENGGVAGVERNSRGSLGKDSPSVSIGGDIRANPFHAPSQPVEVVIASGDMDTLQLVDDKRVQVYTLRKGIKDTILYDEKAVRERFGFGPELLPDYKGLRGDPSDNIIGIKGIGDKTATILIQNFGTIEDMYKVLKKDEKKFKDAGLTDRIIGLLKEGEEEALFSKMLATIRRDAPIDFKLPEKEWKESVDIEKVEELFKVLEFRSLGVRVKEVLGLTDAFGAPTVAGVERSRPNVAPNRHGGRTLSHTSDGSLAEQTPSVSASSIRASAPHAPSQPPPEPQKLKETALALWVLDSNITDPGLEDILRHTKANTFSEAREIILGEIEKRNLKKVYAEIELPLIPVIDGMHTRGIKIDTEYLKKLSTEYHAKLEEIQKQIWQHAGEEFNINSPKQLGSILFDKLGLKAKGQRKTAGGAKSTRESELDKMKGMHPIIDLILHYRELQKLLSTYIDNIPNLLEKDGRLHTTFIQTGTTTGRMSSQNPNLQNIPIKSELGRNIRKAFVAEKGFVLAALDYSQIELRLAAIMSGDKGLIDIFKSGRDVHTEVASRVFKVPAEKVDKEMRRKAKVINFGILYGMGVNALKQNLGGTREEAQLFYNEYFNTFTGLAAYLEEVKKEAARQGYTETMFGRRRSFEGISSRIPYIRAAAERMAINAPIQGTEADIMKIAMVKVSDLIKEKKWNEDAYLLLQVHDELIFEVRKTIVTEFCEKVQNIMEHILPAEKARGVPIVTDCETGPTWGDMK